MSRNPVALTFSTFYFLFYVMVSVNLAFMPIHFREIGFSALQIALLSSGMSVASLCGAPIYGQLLIRSANRRPLLLATTFSAFVFFTPLLVLKSFYPVLVCYGLYFLANNGIAIANDTEAVRRSFAQDIKFERVRVWGSIGFVLSSLLFGSAIDLWGADIVAPISAASLLVLSTYAWKKRTILARDEVDSLVSSKLRRPFALPENLPSSVWFILLTILLIWASHGVLYVYFSLYLRTLNWGGSEIALAWNIGVVTEIAFFYLFSKIKNIFSLRQIFISSIVLTMVRWAILAVTVDKSIIMVSQVLHGWSFGLFYLSAIELLHECLPEVYRSRGQSWISAWGPGAGSLSGRIFFGSIAGELTSPEQFQQLFFYAVGIAAGGLVVSLNLRRTSEMVT